MLKKACYYGFIFFFLLTLASCSTPKEPAKTQEPEQNQEPVQAQEPAQSQDPDQNQEPTQNQDSDTKEEPTSSDTSSNNSSNEQPKENKTPDDVSTERKFVVHPTNFLISPVTPSDTDEKFVLLTFDDTPTAKSTKQILDTLDKYQAKALFFVNGHYAEPNLELLKEIKNRGHLIGNHTWWHIYIRKENAETVRKEIVGLSDFLEKHLGERPKYFRPPFGQNSDVSRQIIKEEGMQTMNWSNGSLDWELKTPEAIAKQVLSNVKNGDNILFHDKQTTADALGPILAELQKQGYQFVLPTEVKLAE